MRKQPTADVACYGGATRPDRGRRTVGCLCLSIVVMFAGANRSAGQFTNNQPVPRNQPAEPQMLELPSDWLPASFTAPGNDRATTNELTGTANELTGTVTGLQVTSDESLTPAAGRDDSYETIVQAGYLSADRDEVERFLFHSHHGPQKTARPPLWRRIVSDHRNYYDAQSFRLLASGFLIGAAFANTALDGEIQDHFQTSVRGATSDEWSEFLHGDKALGNGNFTLPIFAAAWATGEIFNESPLLLRTGHWGERSMRSFLVGAPSVMLAQRLTGGSRPGEKDRDSRWLPFQDNNGVSGHSFMAALPFINAAKMTENRWLKAGFYSGSLLGPLSRINDDDHYPSQAALGWLMAYVAASAIDRTEQAGQSVQFAPYATSNGVGGMFELQY